MVFGVARGAATGVAERRGAIELASGGVLLLDEIGDMALLLEAKLLRALQEREVIPAGAGRPARRRSCRQRDEHHIEARVENGAFRRDLFYRLAGAVVASLRFARAARTSRGWWSTSSAEPCPRRAATPEGSR